MSIHYVVGLNRFRDTVTGRYVNKTRGLKSSIARREYQSKNIVLPAKPPPRPTPRPKSSPSPRRPPRRPLRPPTPTRTRRPPPWEHEGVVREYPEPEEWFADDGVEYDDLIFDWGDYDQDDTSSDGA